MNTHAMPPTTGQPPVCITGMGLCLPVAQGTQEVIQALIAGKDAFAPARSFNASMLASDLVSEFGPDTSLFGLQKSELETLDRGTWFALAALREAMAQARVSASSFPPERVGIVLGSSHAGIQHIERCYQELSCGRPVPLSWLDAACTEHSAAIAAERLGAKGPRATVSSACASSNTAVGVALDWLAHNEADCVVVLGTDTISPSILAGFNSLRAVSKAPTAPFSTPAGITLGEGAGVLVLEREASAHLRGCKPLAWVRGYALSGDAYHETATDTEGAGVEAAMRAALADARLEPHQIDYVSAHGTGTDANDIPEAHATARVVGPNTPLSSPKSFLGHTLGASGVVELIVSLLFAERGLIAPTRHFAGVRPGCPALNYVPNTPAPHATRHFLCNNYGFGGNNSSLVISRESGAGGHRAAHEPVLLVGYGAVGGFGTSVQALLDQLWTHQRPVAERGSEGGLAVVSATQALKGMKLPGNSRASTMIRSAIAAVGQALQHGSASALVAADPRRCALIAGVSHSALRHVEKMMASVFQDGLQYASATHFPLTTMNATGGQVSIAYGIKGYNTTFCGAGAALHYAHRIVSDGRQDRAITFGADEVSPLLLLALAQFPGLHDPGLAPLGEGAAALILERASAAKARGIQGLAWIRAVACTQPCATAQWADTLARAAIVALAQAQVLPTHVSAVVLVGHGPTALRQAELQAVEQVFLKVPALISAAPVAGLSASALLAVHVLLAAEILRRGELPPAGADLPARRLEPGPLLVLHPALGGECHAVVVDHPGGARP